MKKDEYEMTQTLLLSHWRILQSLDLVAFLNAIEHENALAPILDPTLYRKGMSNLDIIKDLAEKALASKGVDCMALIPDVLAHQAEQAQKGEQP